jgi:hypothetical protein
VNTTPDPIDELLDAIERADLEGTDVFAADAVLDATVPNWRFTVRSGPQVRAQLAS